MAEINVAPAIMAPHLQMFKRVSREGLLNGDAISGPIDHTITQPYSDRVSERPAVSDAFLCPVQDEGGAESQLTRPLPQGSEAQQDILGSQSSHPGDDNHEAGLSFASSLLQARRLAFPKPLEKQCLDMICVGFGPASLAIAIALADMYASRPSCGLPKVLFLEKQDEFAWHAGMQLPEAKMQISFLKDLATPRDPTSPFTFINYLHQKGRLHQFINLSTFLPSRMEYEDYMRWCASHFDDAVIYGQRVVSVEQCDPNKGSGKIESFKVTWRDTKSGKRQGHAFSRHVVIAAGGRPFIPPEFIQFTNGSWPKVQHSSQYATTMKRLEDLAKGHVLHTTQSEALACEKKLSDVGLGLEKHKFVVVGNGQSAAEIFNDLWARFPKAEIILVIKGSSLRPSDDSPFVNEIFDPDRVDGIYDQDPEQRKKALALDRGTNYGVVRLELLERIYEKLYLQRLQDPEEKNWRCRILTNRTVISADLSSDGQSLDMNLVPTSEILAGRHFAESIEMLQSTLVFTATGYQRNAHEEILSNTKSLLPCGGAVAGFPVGRNYKVQYDAGKVDNSSGIWLQGCNEGTHGLSDTLLSILAVRGGEMVRSIFGDDFGEASAFEYRR